MLPLSATAHPIASTIVLLLMGLATGSANAQQVAPTGDDQPALSQTPKDDTPNPIISKVQKLLGDRSPQKPFVLQVRLSIKEDQIDAFVSGMAQCAKQTRKEEANVRYQLLADAADPTQFMIDEQWKNFSGFVKHIESAHTVQLLDQLGGWVSAEPQIEVFMPRWLKTNL